MNALIRAALAGVLVTLAGIASAADTKSVAITQIVEHPALDAARQGVQDELKAEGYTVGGNLQWTYESAQGNPGTAAQIARTFVGKAPDVIVAISTPSAQAVVAATRDIPVVFTAVTDPLGAKLVGDLKNPGGNVTGVSDLSPIPQHLDLIARITPNAKRIGVISNPGEANSVTLVGLLKEHAPARGMTIVEAAAPRSNDVLAAARSLVGKVDVIYVPTDNTVVSALEAVIKTGIENKIPVYAGDTDSVPRGAIAALGFNYYDVGRQTGAIVARVLKGEKPGAIPVESIQKTDLAVNLKSAAAMGVTIPAEVVSAAKTVIK
jgi:putative tryptophan/tyrosine transport system substrate-binding protein